MRTYILGATLALAVTSQADACSVGPFNTVWGQNTETTMSVERGKGCAILVRTNATSVFDRVYISKQPRNGKAEMRPSNSPGYRSNPNFTGQDEFAATLCGRDRDRSGCSVLRVRVTVN